MKLNKIKLEIDILDFCNLNCPLCVRGIPLQKNKKFTSLDELERISKFIKPFEFHTIKIGGGEPTLHPQFAEICDNLKRLFPAQRYYLATNGFQLEKFKDHLQVFDIIELTEYRGRNEGVFDLAVKLNLPNLVPIRKQDYKELEDIYQESNSLKKVNVYNRCIYRKITIIIQDRIYPCCNIFGQALRQNIDPDMISVPVDENWRENLAKISIESYCRRCFVDVPSPAKAMLNETISSTGRWLRDKIKPLDKYILQKQIQRQKNK
ncbi:MAG TPA: radical SAM protein [bacterium]|nr:radical SAM protein [bacterium]